MMEDLTDSQKDADAKQNSKCWEKASSSIVLLQKPNQKKKKENPKQDHKTIHKLRSIRCYPFERKRKFAIKIMKSICFTAAFGVWCVGARARQYVLNHHPLTGCVSMVLLQLAFPSPFGRPNSPFSSSASQAADVCCVPNPPHLGHEKTGVDKRGLSFSFLGTMAISMQKRWSCKEIFFRQIVIFCCCCVCVCVCMCCVRFFTGPSKFGMLSKTSASSGSSAAPGLISTQSDPASGQGCHPF